MMSLQRILSSIPYFKDDTQTLIAISKKDDDFAQRMLDIWKRQFPLARSKWHWEALNRKEYCVQILRGIRVIPYTPSTTEAIGDHLVVHAAKSSAMRHYLIEQLDMAHPHNLKNEELRVTLAQRVRYVCSEDH
jgi:hypothetical protein